MHRFLRTRGRSRRLLYAAVVALLLAVTIGAYSVVGAGLLQGSPAGPQWRVDGLAGETVHALALGRRHPSLIFAATETGIYRRQGAGAWVRVLNHPSVWSVRLLPDDRTVVAGDEGGDVDISNDGGAHWRVHRVTSGAVYAAAVAPGRHRLLLAGGDGGVYRSVDGGERWQRTLALRQSAGAALAWQPGSPQVVFAGMVAGGPAGATEVYVSRDAGRTWRVYGRGLRSGSGIMSLAVNGGPRVYAGTMGRAVWSVDGVSASWRRTARGMPAGEDHVAAIATLAPAGSMAAGTLGFGVFRTLDGGRSWERMSAGLQGSDDSMIVLSLAWDPHTHMLFAGTAAGVFTIGPLESNNETTSAGADPAGY